VTKSGDLSGVLEVPVYSPAAIDINGHMEFSDITGADLRCPPIIKQALGAAE
jgi:hypothetical protein